MTYFRRGIRNVIEPQAGSMTGAIAGQFVVGDGTLVGQGATTVGTANKPKLVLNGKAFTTVLVSGDFQYVAFSVRPKLLLLGKQTAVMGDSTALAQLPPKLILKGKAVSLIIPEFAHMGRSSLVLKGKAFSLITSSTPVVGKPKLILNGKLYHAGVIALTPTIPINVSLVPTTPQSVTLAAAVPLTYDLVPTEEEFR